VIDPRRLAAAALVAAVACGGGERGGGDSARPSAPDTATAEIGGPTLTENDVLAVIDAVNATDVRLAGVGVAKATDPDVKRFASRLGSAHPQKVTDRPPAAPELSGSAILAPLRARGADALSLLDTTPAGPRFDRTYVDAQVELHTLAVGALASLDEGAARAGPYPTLVARTRDEVRQHLGEAQALQRRLR
jgi:predicted outer membrane protein